MCVEYCIIVCMLLNTVTFAELFVVNYVACARIPWIHMNVLHRIMRLKLLIGNKALLLVLFKRCRNGRAPLQE